MPRKRLTDASIKRMKHTGSGRWTDVGDSELRGLHIRVFNTGTKKWFLRHRGSGRREVFAEWPMVLAEEARERAYELLRGRPQAPTMARVVQHYRENHRTPRGGRPDDRANTRCYLRLIESELGEHELSSITPDQVRKMLTKKDGFPAAQNAALAMTRGLFRHARREGWYEGRDPTEPIKKNPSSPRNRGVTLDERGQILSELQRIAPLSSYGPVRFAAEYGCRIGEAIMLKWSDIQGDRVRIPPNKNSPERVVPLEPAIQALLEKCRLLESDTWVFPGNGGHIKRGTVWEWWAKARANTGIEDFVTHDLRHERATHWLMSDVNLKVVSAILGHRDPVTTLRTYQDVLAKDVFDRFPREIKHCQVDGSESQMGAS